MPRIDEYMDSLGEVRLFTSMDILWGCLQMPTNDKDKDNATFTSHLGTYRYTCVPFGIRNAPASV